MALATPTEQLKQKTEISAKKQGNDDKNLDKFLIITIIITMLTS